MAKFRIGTIDWAILHIIAIALVLYIGSAIEF